MSIWSTPQSPEGHGRRISKFTDTHEPHITLGAATVIEHHFTIVLDHSPADDEVEALYEAGCSDAAIIGGPGSYGAAEFDREAPTLAEAIVSAVRDVEKVGFRAVRVLDEDLLTLADIADRIGKSREAVRLYATGKRGPGGFPPPINPDGDVKFWRWSEVGPWLKAYGAKVPDIEPTLAAANLALQFRALSRSPEAAPLRALVA